MLRTESLTKYYGHRCAVRDFSIAIEERAVVGFLGLNGAGKTTALRMLAGLLTPSGGRVLVDGQDLAGPRGHLARARIGFLPDRPPVYEEMTVRGYLAFAARLRGRHGVEPRVARVLERTGLLDYADEAISTLSHGYRQRVGIAQAIVHDPVLVILDEPTSGLDPTQIVEMRGLVRSLGGEHTVLLSSHNLVDVSETCDQILVIDQGRLVAQGAPSELAARMGTSGRKLAFTLVGEATAIASATGRAAEAGLTAGPATITAAGPGIHEVELEARLEPEVVARFLFDAGFGLRRMQPAARPLETLFAELTRRAS